MNEEKKRYTFELEASPIAWLNYAQELREAANIIISNSPTEINRFPDLLSGYTLQNAFFLNFGYSIENLIKGTLIAEDPEYINDHKISDQISSNHNMIALAEKISTTELNKKEKKLLEVLSEAIPYWGRYPIPKKATKIKNKYLYYKNFHVDMEEVWNKLAVNLYNLIKDGDWVSPSGIRIGQFLDSTFETNMDEAISILNKKMANGEKLKQGNVDFSKTIYVKSKS